MNSMNLKEENTKNNLITNSAKIILPILIVGLLVGASIFFLNTTKSNEVPKSEYITTYQAQDLDKLSDKQVNILYFAKDGEVSTKVIESNLSATNNDTPKGIKIYKVDFNNEELRNKYNVQWPNTFVRIDKDKNIIKANYSLTNWDDILRLAK